MLIKFFSALQPLKDAITIIERLEDRANLKSSPARFSLIISRRPPLSTVSLHILPPFFARFICNQNLFTNVSIYHIWNTMWNFNYHGFSAVTLDLQDYHRYVFSLIFHCHVRTSEKIVLPTCLTFEEENVGQIDYTSFVSFEFHEFRRMINQLKNAAYIVEAWVTIMDSEVKFTNRSNEFILSKERGQCIIGGFGGGERYHSPIILDTLHFYFNINSERLWLFKSRTSYGIMLIAPIGLHVQISSHVPLCWFKYY